MTTTSDDRPDLGSLRYLAAKVARVHGALHPDLPVLAEVVGAMADGPVSDHQGRRALAARMRALTGDFKPWAGACGSVYQLFHELSAVVSEVESTS